MLESQITEATRSQMLLQRMLDEVARQGGSKKKWVGFEDDELHFLVRNLYINLHLPRLHP